MREIMSVCKLERLSDIQIYFFYSIHSQPTLIFHQNIAFVTTPLGETGSIYTNDVFITEFNIVIESGWTTRWTFEFKTMLGDYCNGSIIRVMNLVVYIT